jgi:hypothetical protein
MGNMMMMTIPAWMFMLPQNVNHTADCISFNSPKPAISHRISDIESLASGDRSVAWSVPQS